MNSRTNSFSSSTSSRLPSVSSRNTSNSSFASSIGYGNRPASINGGRPQTAMARPTSYQPKSRPATSMDIHSSDDELPSSRKNKGMKEDPFHSPTQFQGHQELECRKLRGPQSLRSTHTLRSRRKPSKSRDVSVSSAMSRLRIDSGPRLEGYQAISTTMKPPPRKAQPHNPSITNRMQDMRIESNENALILYQATGDVVAPKTPSHSQIPVLSKSEAHIFTPETPCRASTASPTKTPFLSKDSNIIAFTAWDVDARVDKMESMYSQLKATVDDTALHRKTLEETQEVYRARSKFCSISSTAARVALECPV
jgi:kinesin family member C1